MKLCHLYIHRILQLIIVINLVSIIVVITTIMIYFFVPRFVWFSRKPIALDSVDASVRQTILKFVVTACAHCPELKETMLRIFIIIVLNNILFTWFIIYRIAPCSLSLSLYLSLDYLSLLFVLSSSTFPRYPACVSRHQPIFHVAVPRSEMSELKSKNVTDRRESSPVISCIYISAMNMYCAIPQYPRAKQLCGRVNDNCCEIVGFISLLLVKTIRTVVNIYTFFFFLN